MEVESESPPRSVASAPRSRARFAWVLGVVLAVLVPVWGTLDSPWIAEDAAILAHVDRAPLGDDLFTPQYGLRLVRFWRPVVTASWWIQERLSGIAPLPLRLFNLALQAATVLGVGLVVLRLGGGTLAALLAAVLAAGFPHQGGTVVWLAGRTDGLVGVWFVAAVAAALAERRVLTLLVVALACATKEFAFVLPAWIGLFVWARAGLPAAWRAAWPAALVAGAGLALRQAAVGSFFGGYAGGASAVRPGLLAGALLDAAEGIGPSLWLLPAFVLAGWCAGTLRWRVVAAGLGAMLTAALPLVPLLVKGPLAPQNERLLWVVDLGLVLGCTGGFLGLGAPRTGPAPAGGRSRLLAAAPLLVFAVAVLLRFSAAAADAQEWSEAAWRGEAAVRTARARAAEDPPSVHPLLWDGFPATHGGAYCLGFGLADRFRPPFPPSARPVWPLRTLFFDRTRLRPRLSRPDAHGFRDPFDPAARRVPRLAVELDGAAFDPTAPGVHVPVDERVPLAEVDRSPRLSILGAPADAALEAVLLTEAGLESGLAGAFDAAGGATFTLSELCATEVAGGVAHFGQVLIQTADLGATAAYLEVRALDAEGRILAATPPVRLEWEADLLDRLDS